MARPRKVIDWEHVANLCGIQATQEEIAQFVKCSVDTLDRACKRMHKESFAEFYKKKAVGGKMSLRRNMFQKAFGGNVTMMIWLSKQHLGMSDKFDPKAQVIGAQTITHKWVVMGKPEEEKHAEPEEIKKVQDEWIDKD